MSYLPSDPLNCEIIALSLALQREISKDDGPEGPEVGAQQVMPKPEHVGLFGPRNPLPWVPDRVGKEFSRENNGVLVVGSSYNGFVERYSARSMALADYLAIRDLIREADEDPKNPKVVRACAKFVRDFEAQVMAPDQSTYYGPILNSLLGTVGVPAARVCLTDLCKASFVRRGSNADGHVRGDEGNDGIIKDNRNWPLWTKCLTCKPTLESTPLPYQWIWKRMQQCRHIVALGTVAEYGVLKIFREIAKLPTISTRNSGRIHLNISLTPKAPWKYCYADSKRAMSHWLDNDDWWILSDGHTGRYWHLLPAYHPAARPPHADRAYKRTRPVFSKMIEMNPGASNGSSE